MRFFASCREIAGMGQVELQIQPGETISRLLQALQHDFPRLPVADVLVAVDAEFVKPGYVLQDGDEVALMPPVSGG